MQLFVGNCGAFIEEGGKCRHCHHAFIGVFASEELAIASMENRLNGTYPESDGYYGHYREVHAIAQNDLTEYLELLGLEIKSNGKRN